LTLKEVTLTAGLNVVDGTTLRLAGTWTNLATLAVNGGTLNLGGNFTLASLWTLTRSGGTINLTGTLDASATGLNLDAGTGSWNLAGGTLRGGTYSASGGAELVFTTQGGTLDGITAASNLDLATNDGATVYVSHGLTLDHVAVLLGSANSSTSTGGYLGFQGNQTLGGIGEVVFGTFAFNTLYIAPYSTLTIASGISVHGIAGVIFGDSLVNQGIVQADSGPNPAVAGRTLSVQAGSFINQGTLQADDTGILSLTNFVVNKGTMTAEAGGTITVNGAFTEGSGATTKVFLGGTSSSQIGQVNVTGAASLAGTLNVALANGFVPASGDTFQVLVYASHTGVFDQITGVNLPDGLVFSPSYSSTALSLEAA
jgi:hypothetical protein